MDSALTEALPRETVGRAGDVVDDSEGRAVAEAGPAAVVYNHPAHPYTRALPESAPIPNPNMQRARRTVAEAACQTALHTLNRTGRQRYSERKQKSRPAFGHTPVTKTTHTGPVKITRFQPASTAT